MLDGRLRRGSGEHRQAPEKLAFGRVQQVIAPVERAANRALARREVARARRQQVEALAQVCQHRSWTHRSRARGRQLNGQWEAFEPQANLGDERIVTCARAEV